MTSFAPLSKDELESAEVVTIEAVPDEAERRAKAAALVKERAPIKTTPVDAYLRGRGLGPAAIPRGCVGWHGSSKAMLAVGIDRKQEISCVQRLFFGSDGNPLFEDGKKKRRTSGCMRGAALTIPGDGVPLICEGIEDALSLHLATGRPVYAAFGTSCLGDVPVPAGASVVVVADNDDAGREGARKAALHLTGRGHTVSIATPPDGFKDVNEVLLGMGAAAVAVMVSNAEPFEPGPRYRSFGPFRMSDGGLMRQSARGHGDEKEIVEEKISAAFEILGLSRSSTGSDWGRWIRWADSDGRQHLRHISDATIHGDAAALCGSLACEGLWIDRNAQKAFVSYVSGATVDERITLTHRVGWHEIDGAKAFVLPHRTIGASGGQVIVDGLGSHAFEVRGDLDAWKAGVGAITGDHVIATLAVSAALSGPLLDLVGAESGGLHLCGPSSIGKSSILFAAASVWGRGAMSPGFVRSWRSTAGALENAAAAACDCSLVLDELGLVSSADAHAALYSLASGQAKGRLSRDTSLRESRTWRISILSSGELGIQAKLKEDRGRRARVGQLIRVVDVPANRGPFGCFDAPGETGDAAALSKKLKSAAASNFGVAGSEFIARVLSENITAGQIREIMAGFLFRHLPAKSTGQIDRVGERLALIGAAGELATALGVTGWREGVALEAAGWALSVWVASHGGSEPGEVRMALEQIRLLIEEGEARFEDVVSEAPRPVQNRLGFKSGHGEAKEYWISAEVWRAVFCAGYDAKAIARALGERGYLEKTADGWQPRKRVDGMLRRFYVVRGSILEGE